MLMRTHRQADMMKEIFAFRNFANAPEHKTSQCTNRTNCILHSSTFFLRSRLCIGGPCAGACLAFRPFSKACNSNSAYAMRHAVL